MCDCIYGQKNLFGCRDKNKSCLKKSLKIWKFFFLLFFFFKKLSFLLQKMTREIWKRLGELFALHWGNLRKNFSRILSKIILQEFPCRVRPKAAAFKCWGGHFNPGKFFAEWFVRFFKFINIKTVRNFSPSNDSHSINY